MATSELLLIEANQSDKHYKMTPEILNVYVA